MKQKRLLFLLVLLMTAATGAWAQDAKHVITATYREQTRSLEQPLPYETTVGALYEAVTGKSISDLLSIMTEMPLTGITSNNSDVVSIGGFNGASTPVTVNADGKATVILHFGNFAQGIFVSVVPPLYVTMADGTKDADKWTATVGTSNTANPLPVGGLSEKDAVTLTYGGRLKVKNVTATTDAEPDAWDGDLSKLTAESTAEFATATDGMTITGRLGANVKVSIAAGATVTLKDVNINAGDNYSYKWAGITCLGDATIILADNSENTVKGFYNEYPGIYVPSGKTLTIQGGSDGNGKLTASSNGYAAGIGGGYNIACGTIVINSGTVEATGGAFAAGIGGGNRASCGNITINGGTITATGGKQGPGIGGGNSASCGNITIANTVTKVTATKGTDAPYSIGAGNGGSCVTVAIGGTKYWENNAAVDNDAATYLAQATIVYPKWDGDLSKLTAESTAEFATATDGMTIKGTLAANVKVSIAAGATVTLDGVTIVGDDDENYKWAGLNCLGNATIILKDRTQNRVQGFHEDYPGIHVPAGSRLTITGGTLGNGMLTATSSGYGAGIGGGNIIHCGNIDIQGGYIAATGGIYAAGIGGGLDAICGNITISGGTVRAMGGPEAAGIGGGSNGRCGGIMITNGVTRVFAMKDDHSPYSIGAGNGGSCVTVAIGGTVYWQDNAAVNDGDEYLATNPLEYRPMPQP